MTSKTKLGLAWILLYFWILLILTGSSLLLSLQLNTAVEITIMFIGGCIGLVGLFWSLNIVCGDYGKK